MSYLRLAVVLLAIAGASPIFAGDDEVDFVGDIRPVLSNHCFRCHGLDEAALEGELRLNESNDVPSDVLLQRIMSEDPDEQMPPPDSDLKLTEQQKQLLRRWVEGGAIYQQHWSFRPITPPAIPDTEAEQHPIDFFVQCQLQAAGLTPSDEAARQTLIR
jgi:mono/diheme cytochrome c family protein